jgi:hypothetical protein
MVSSQASSLRPAPQGQYISQRTRVPQGRSAHRSAGASRRHYPDPRSRHGVARRWLRLPATVLKGEASNREKVSAIRDSRSQRLVFDPDRVLARHRSDSRPPLRTVTMKRLPIPTVKAFATARFRPGQSLGEAQQPSTPQLGPVRQNAPLTAHLDAWICKKLCMRCIRCGALSDGRSLGEEQRLKVVVAEGSPRISA